MNQLLRRFRGGDGEIDYEELRARAMYPELIGRQVEADTSTPHFMNCACGMLIMSSAALAGERAECQGCAREIADQAGRERKLPSTRLPPPRVMSRRGESRVLAGIAVFVIVACGYFVVRLFDAPPRAQAAERLVLD